MRYLLLIPALLAAGAAVPLAVEWVTAYPAVALFAALCVAAMLPVLHSALLRAAGRPRLGDPFSPSRLLPLVLMLFYGLGPLPALIRDPESQVRVYAVGLVGLLAYLIGCSLAARGGSWVLFSRPFLSGRRWVEAWSQERLMTWLLLLFGVAVASMTLYFRRGGVPLLAESVAHARVEALRAAGGYLLFLGAAGNIAVICGFFVFFGRRSSRSARASVLALSALMLALLALTGTRNLLLFTPAILIVFYHYLHRRIRAGTLVFGSLLLIFVARAHLLLRALRSQEVTHIARLWLDPVLSAREKISSIALGFVTVEAENFRFVLDWFPAESPYLYGRGMLMTLSTALPGSQESLTEYLQGLSGQRFTGFGLTPTLIGGFYLEAGIAGVALGMAGLGFALQKLYQRMCDRPSETTVLLYGLATVLAITMLKNSFLGNVMQLWYLVVALASIRFCQRSIEVPGSEPAWARPER